MHMIILLYREGNKPNGEFSVQIVIFFVNCLSWMPSLIILNFFNEKYYFHWNYLQCKSVKVVSNAIIIDVCFIFKLQNYFFFQGYLVEMLLLQSTNFFVNIIQAATVIVSER